jgi:uncharacterized protein
MRRRLFRLVGLLVITGVLSGVPVQAAVTNKRGTITITQGPTKVTIVVDVADTLVSRAQGLGLRTSLPETAGMLFVYETVGFWDFAMTDTIIPLSVAFIDYDPDTQQWEIAEIVDLDVAPNPHTGPFRVYQAAKPFRFALEVNQGFFQRHNLTVGARVQDTTGALLSAPVRAAATNKQGTLTITQGPTEVTLAVDVADTPQGIWQGLAFRTSLAETAGMLFVFQSVGFQGFSMLDVIIPLSVAFIADLSDQLYLHRPAWVIVDIQDMNVAPNPHNGPFRVYQAARPCRYALQVNQGFFQRHSLTVGAKVRYAPP